MGTNNNTMSTSLHSKSVREHRSGHQNSSRDNSGNLSNLSSLSSSKSVKDKHLMSSRGLSKANEKTIQVKSTVLESANPKDLENSDEKSGEIRETTNVYFC